LAYGLIGHVTGLLVCRLSLLITVLFRGSPDSITYVLSCLPRVFGGLPGNFARSLHGLSRRRTGCLSSLTSALSNLTGGLSGPFASSLCVLFGTLADLACCLALVGFSNGLACVFADLPGGLIGTLAGLLHGSSSALAKVLHRRFSTRANVFDSFSHALPSIL